jgi:N-methylhydantoinase A
LGFIDPSEFLGGEFVLDAAAAKSACARLGESIGLNAEDTAWGIRQIALAGMVKATRSRLAAFGLDPRQYGILSFGGSGSLFTAEIAAALEAEFVLIPELASVFSAFGAATTDVRRERIRSVLAVMPIPIPAIQKILDELADEIEQDLIAEGIAEENRITKFEADLRFSKQIYELQMPIGSTKLSPDSVEVLLEDFKQEYASRYGQGSIVLQSPIELVNLRVIGIGKTLQANLGVHETGETDGTVAPEVRSRAVRVQRGPGGLHDAAVFGPSDLRPGHVLRGPALIDKSDTTVWIPAQFSGKVDHYGTLKLERTK